MKPVNLHAIKYRNSSDIPAYSPLFDELSEHIDKSFNHLNYGSLIVHIKRLNNLKPTENVVMVFDAYGQRQRDQEFALDTDKDDPTRITVPPPSTFVQQATPNTDTRLFIYDPYLS